MKNVLKTRQTNQAGHKSVDRNLMQFTTEKICTSFCLRNLDVLHLNMGTEFSNISI